MNDDIIDDGAVHFGDGITSQPLDAQTGQTITEAAKWGKYYLILAGIGLLLQPVLQYFNMKKVQASMDQVLDNDLLLATQVGTQIFTYLFLIAILGYPIYRFYEFVTKTPIAIERQDHQGFVHGIDSLKATYKYLGIATLVIIGLYVVLIGLGVVAALFISLAN